MKRLLQVHGQPDPVIEKSWAEEANRRWEAFLRGEVFTLPAEEAFAKLGTKRS